MTTIVAEMGASHCQDLTVAFDVIRSAAHAGADFIKLQTFKPEWFAKRNYKIQGGMWADMDIADLYDKAYLPWEWHKELFEYAKSYGIGAFSTPFGMEAVEYLENLHCPRYKLASFNLRDLDLIACAVNTGKPVAISTGMGNESEIDAAVNTALKYGSAAQLTLLHCVSAYPAKVTDYNLSNMLYFKEKYGCRYGVSDHTMSLTVAVCAAALGAEMIEKHIRTNNRTLDRFAATPADFGEMAVLVHAAMGLVSKPVDIYPRESERLSLDLRDIRGTS